MSIGSENQALFDANEEETLQGRIVVEVESSEEHAETATAVPQDLAEEDAGGALRRFLEAQDASSIRKKTAALGALFAVLCLASLCFCTSVRSFVSPVEVVQCYALWFQQLLTSFTSPIDVLTPQELTALQPNYYQVVNQFGVTFITALAGVLLALAGTLYQNVFRNPIASPSMLGVSSGVELGLVVLVAVFGTGAAGMVETRYLFCYVAVVVVLALVFVLSELMTKRGQPVSITNILLVAMLVSALCSVVSTYISAYFFDLDQWFVYSGLVEVVAVNTTSTSVLFIVVSALIGIVPVLLLRFRMNMLSFGDADMRLLGVSPGKLRAVALACGTVMMLAAQIAVGTVALVSLVVPNISRVWYGAEFRRQFVGNCLLGACLLVVCRIVTQLIPFVGGGFPIGVIVSFVVLPAFVWIVAASQKGWD